MAVLIRRTMPKKSRNLGVPPWMLLGCLAAWFGAMGQAPAPADSLRRTAVVKAVEQTRHSIVNIHGRKTIRGDDSGTPREGSFRLVNGMGTGVVIDRRGYILTNYHVVEDVEQIQVTLANQKQVIGELISHDGAQDLAVIKIPRHSTLQLIEIGTSGDLMLGEPVIAVGNAYGYNHTVSEGIISALHRNVQVSDTQRYKDVIQTNASINPGNSGGPLLNIEGKMVGLVVAVRVGAQGIGFAIPVNDAMEVAADLLTTERIEGFAHGVVGKTTFHDHRPQFTVRSLVPHSAAAQSKLQAGDVIEAIAGTQIQRRLDFERALIGRAPGDKVEMTLRRDDRRIAAALPLGKSIGAPPVADRAWRLLGLRLKSIPQSEFQQKYASYRGGLRVSAVRANSPAARQGILPGDILIGMHKWETVTLDNISFIIDSREFSQRESIKFYILRDAEPLYGYLRMASRN